MNFSELVQVFEELEKTSSGNEMRAILADFFKKVPKNEIKVLTYLSLGKIASDYEDIILGMAEKMVIKSISIAASVNSKKVIESLKDTGDIGLTAEKILQKKSMTLIPRGKLTINDVFTGLRKIAELSGSGSQDLKIKTLASLLQKASAKDAKYLIRILLGTLRLGVADMSILDALAICFTGEKKNKAILEHAYNICPDVGIIAETLAKKGLHDIEKISIQVGRPIKMMMGQRVQKLEEISEKIPGEVTVEAKYDGERIQAHKTKVGKITLFSRRLDVVTNQFPDLIKYLKESIKEDEFIIEGEVIAVDKTGRPLPFQTLMQRRRKYDIEKYVAKIPIQFKVFDILYLNGKSYLNEPYSKRCDVLEKIVKKHDAVMLTERIITDDLDKINKFFHKMLKAGYEGIFIKSRASDSIYQAGVRGWNWIKWKKEYVKGMVDTFDLVVIGAFYGRGKRSGTYGALLCAAYNNKKDVFETVCKLGTGLTDEILEQIPKKLERYKLDHKPARVDVKKEMEPDVWFEPAIVVEVLGAELTRSPTHTCMIKDGKGLALRFPRFIRFRPEKLAEEATTSNELSSLYK